MDISKPPDANDLAVASGIWKWLLFFAGLIGVGGAVEYWLNKRYATKRDLEMFRQSCTSSQSACKQHIMDQLEIALMKNNERLEERMVAAVSTAAATAITTAMKAQGK